MQCKQEVPSREWLLQEIVDADALYQRAPVKADKELLDKGAFSVLFMKETCVMFSEQTPRPGHDLRRLREHRRGGVPEEVGLGELNGRTRQRLRNLLPARIRL